LNKANPATIAGLLTMFKLYVKTAGIDDLFYGVFYNTDGDNWTCRSAGHSAVADGAGLKTVTGLSLDIQVGDCVAFYWKNSSPEMTQPGEDDVYISYSAGNLCSPDSSGSFPDWIAAGKATFSIQGIGDVLSDSGGESASPAALLVATGII